MPQNQIALRLGLSYVRGLREEAGRALVREREHAPFTSIDDLVRRVPELRKDELVTLAEVGALNFIGEGERRKSKFENRNSTTIENQYPNTRTPEPDPNHEFQFSSFDFRELRRVIQYRHRRDALWQVERAARLVGPLLEEAETRKSKREARDSRG